MMDDTTRDVLAEFERQRTALGELFDSLSPADWARPTPDNETWTVQDVLSHLAATDRSMGSLVKGVVEGTYTVEAAKAFSLDDYNAKQVSRGRERPVAELRGQLDGNRAAFLELVRQVEGAAWQAEVWEPGFSGGAGAAKTLHQRLLAYAAHDADHGAHVRAAIGR